ncbi:hypothetical protein PTSG_10154 [Salpingoeca rosetta]|uniref:ZZ-type domain-containing protein n=1 Tax=Salpingoeca rosetta (strain ATCC 50818 / BSB-021) TaxID=946362 RepID=F2UQG5_SALR5|nr:uncharacterized protein PTSG_10154 [Salpingoeca rosetta]EGD79870.1 hypothetical protein PTSG_10154 [Salpingoeca rosetta]|eukprot:XP_004988491.1 hypothetical protein PTSG_10154 [Salpingoeca rosetta]
MSRFAAVRIDGHSHCMHHSALQHELHNLPHGLDEPHAPQYHHSLEQKQGQGQEQGREQSTHTEDSARVSLIRSPKRTAFEASPALPTQADKASQQQQQQQQQQQHGIVGPAKRPNQRIHSDNEARSDDLTVKTMSNSEPSIPTSFSTHSNSSTGQDADDAPNAHHDDADRADAFEQAASTDNNHVAFDVPLVASVHETWPAKDYERALQPTDLYICKGCGYFTDCVHYRCRTCADYDLCPACFEAIFDNHQQEPKCQHPKSSFMYMCDGFD